jgi:glycosyltransferase involved in cell wall biosynthesis
LILENSSWTQAETKYFRNLNAKILYPPVHTEKFRKIDNTNRNGLVLTISRFSSDRGLDNVLNVAKKSKKIKFVIAGYLKDPKYFKELKIKKSEY